MYINRCTNFIIFFKCKFIYLKNLLVLFKYRFKIQNKKKKKIFVQDLKNNFYFDLCYNYINLIYLYKVKALTVCLNYFKFENFHLFILKINKIVYTI